MDTLFLKLSSGTVINVAHLIMFNEKQYFVSGRQEPQEPQEWKKYDYINALKKLNVE